MVPIGISTVDPLTDGWADREPCRTHYPADHLFLCRGFVVGRNLQWAMVDLEEDDTMYGEIVRNAAGPVDGLYKRKGLAIPESTLPRAHFAPKTSMLGLGSTLVRTFLRT